ncbi:MAG TPA: hypothetical protein VFS27_05095 [Blastocatellia bacterium]|jgi:hypothetical protein|nr:hypothetical protein [Blastocatellia bacterium]
MPHLIQNVRSQMIRFGVWVKYEDHLRSEDSHKQMMEAWDSAWEAFRNEAPAARSGLENEFRLLLGERLRRYRGREPTQLYRHLMAKLSWIYPLGRRNTERCHSPTDKKPGSSPVFFRCGER